MVPLLTIILFVNALTTNFRKIFNYINICNGFIGFHFYLKLCLNEDEKNTLKYFVLIEIISIIMPILMLSGKLLLNLKGIGYDKEANKIWNKIDPQNIIKIMKNYLVEILFEIVPKVQNTIKVKEKIIGFFSNV